MTRFAGWAVLAGLMLAASAANAQMLVPYRGVSDFDGPYGQPYGAMPPPPAPPPAYGPPPVYNYGGGYGPAVLPLHEVYAVLRDNGFSPLGIPHQRGLVYVIAAIDQRGDDGRVVIDARSGRIIRFEPADGYGYGGPAPYGRNFEAEPMSAHGSDANLPPPTVIRGVPRPPASVPHAASRGVPAPKPSVAAKPAEPTPQQSAAVETKPAAPAPAAPAQPAAQIHPTPAQPSATAAQPSAAPSAHASVSPPPATVGEAKPAPAIRPTQPMPAAQGLD